MTDLPQGFAVHGRFETVLWTAVDARLQEASGTTLASLNMLLIIDATPNCRVFDIARALAITVGGTSQAVDRVEKARWSVRRAHPTDRRSSIVELTHPGRTLLTRAAPVFDEELDRLLSAPLSTADLGHLADSLRALRRSAAAAPGTATRATSPRQN